MLIHDLDASERKQKIERRKKTCFQLQSVYIFYYFMYFIQLEQKEIACNIIWFSAYCVMTVLTIRLAGSLGIIFVTLWRLKNPVDHINRAFVLSSILFMPLCTIPQRPESFKVPTMRIRKLCNCVNYQQNSL